MGKTKQGKGAKLMAVADSSGFPLAVCTTSASPHEVKLVRETLNQRLIRDVSEKLIGDKAYDSDPLDAELAEIGIELIAPHKRNRKRKTEENSGVTNAAGRLKDFLRGCKIIAELLFATSIILIIFSALFISQKLQSTFFD